MSRSKKGGCAVIGAGSWGTTLALLLAGKNLDFDTSLWVHDRELAREMMTTRVNSVYLPKAKLPENLKIFTDLEEVLEGADFVINAVPTQHIREVFSPAAQNRAIEKNASLLSASKGIENGTLKRPSEILEEIFADGSAAVLSGPSFADEVIQRKPTAVTLAAKEPSEAVKLQKLLNTDFFRVYTLEDVTGVELGGALKNVVAIAAGISDGLGLGNNARAALITRGLAEMKRLGAAMGAAPQTFSGLSGLGDLVLTCTAAISRNYAFGIGLAEGLTAAEITATRRTVAEGVKTSKSVVDLAGKMGVEMPIAEQVYRVIYEGKSPPEAVRELMSRSLKNEFAN